MVGKKRNGTRYEDEERRPDQCDEEMRSQTEEDAGDAVRVRGAAKDAARDGLRDLPWRYSAQTIEDDRIDHVQQRGYHRADQDGLRDGAVWIAWHGEF